MLFRARLNNPCPKATEILPQAKPCFDPQSLPFVHGPKISNSTPKTARLQTQMPKTALFGYWSRYTNQGGLSRGGIKLTEDTHIVGRAVFYVVYSA